MIILGLTGSIGMGKSTVASMFAHEGVPVFDADATVHRLLGKGGEAVPLIAEVFPDAVVDGAVDRRRLGAAVFDNPPPCGSLKPSSIRLFTDASAGFWPNVRAAACLLPYLIFPCCLKPVVTGGATMSRWSARPSRSRPAGFCAVKA